MYQFTTRVPLGSPVTRMVSVVEVESVPENVAIRHTPLSEHSRATGAAAANQYAVREAPVGGHGNLMPLT